MSIPDTESDGYLNIIPGSVLVLFSDGIVERLNTSGVEFGVELLKDVIIKNNDQDADEIVNAVFLSAYRFGKKKQWEDDATVVVIKRLL